MSPSYASLKLLLVFTLWWGPTTATTNSYFRMPDENANAGNANAPSYNGHCDATIKASEIPSDKHLKLATLDLDNISETEPHYGFFRWGVMSMLQQKGNLHDQNIEYLTGSKTPVDKTADGQDFAFIPSSIYKDGLRMHKTVGPMCGVSRQMGLTRLDIRMRTKNIMLAFLPECRWRDDIMDFPADQPIYSFFAENDLIYLAPNDETRLHAQVDFYLQRWRESESLQEHIRKMAKLSDAYRKITLLTSPDFKLTVADKWDQFVISVTNRDPRSPADGAKYFAMEFKEINR